MHSLIDSDFRGNVRSNLKYKTMATQFYRRKHKNRPKLPKNCEEIKESFENDNSILEKYGFTLDKKSRFYVDTIIADGHSFCVFESTSIINMIKTKIPRNKRKYLLDGTFKTAAKPFTQLLTISVEFKNEVRFGF